MKRTSRIFLAIGFLVLVIISWAIVLGAESTGDKQQRLIAEAEAYLADDIFIYAIPLLEEAAGYKADNTEKAETLLKQTYLSLMDKRGYQRKYLDLLELQMNREDAAFEVFLEAAQFLLDTRKFAEAYSVLRNGIAKTGSEELRILYESCRYEYRTGYEIFDDVTETYLGTVGVSRLGLWGIATTSGTLFIPCDYEKVSTYSAGRAIVQTTGKTIIAVDNNNYRIAVLKPQDGETYTNFGNFANDRLPVELGGKWYRMTGDFTRGEASFDWVGMHFDGYAAAVSDSKAGVINTSAEWIIQPEYDEVIVDELGRAYAQKSVFVRNGNTVYLISDGEVKTETFEDAKPFGQEGYAAVKKNGLWGFIDTTGTFIIQPQFDDALSFGQHLAGVKTGGYWGYINIYGDIVIEPVFYAVKSFSNGSAPVQTERGWQFITLLEYMEGATL